MATGGSDFPVFTSEEQRAVIRFLWLKGKTGVQIHEELSSVLGDGALSRRTVQWWMQQFKEGRTDVKDDGRSGRPSIINLNLVNQAGEFVRENRTCTLDHIAEKFEISHGTAHSLVQEHLKMRKLFSRWVPYNLTEEHRKQRVAISRIHLERFEKQGNDFLQRIVAGDETWVYSFEPELKQQVSVWRGESFGTGEVKLPQRAKQSQFKVLHIIFFDFAGILLDHAVPMGTSVNAEYYKEVLRTKLRPAIRKKRLGLLESGVILLHDNARPHVAATVKTLLDDYGWEILQHPAYSPDLSPCDFWLFGRMKALLRGRRFTTEEDVNLETKRALRSVAEGGVRDGVFGLLKRWERCVRDDGWYIEQE